MLYMSTTIHARLRILIWSWLLEQEPSPAFEWWNVLVGERASPEVRIEMNTKR